MNQQSARLAIHAASLVGVLINIKSSSGEPMPLQSGHDAIYHLSPGETITIEVQSDERWEQAQAQKLQDLDKDAADDIAAHQEAGPNLTGKTGMTLDEGLQAADRNQVNVDPAAGSVTADTGAQVERSTGSAAGAAPTTTQPTRSGRPPRT